MMKQAQQYTLAACQGHALEQRTKWWQEEIMPKYSIGDHVSWNSEAGRVSGKIVKVHREDFDYKGHRHRASKDDPQYEIKSDKTDHIAAHKEGVLTKIG